MGLKQRRAVNHADFIAFCCDCKRPVQFDTVAEADNARHQSKFRCDSCYIKYLNAKRRKRMRNVLLEEYAQHKYTQPLFIYFIFAREVNRVKIGRTEKTAWHRLQNMEGQGPCYLELLGVVDANDFSEAYLHELFVEQHHHNEWFNMAENIWTFVRKHAFVPYKTQPLLSDEEI